MTKDIVYSALKTFAFTDRLQEVASGRVPAPIHIRIKPTNRCNHSCWYCAYRADQLELGAGMSEDDALPEEKMFEIVEDLIAMDVKAVTFSGGGEPLLYKPLPDVMERLHDAGIKIGCLTNGSNLKGRHADALAKCASWVRVSLDAWDGASYAAARGIKEDAFQKLMDNMRAFHERKSDCVMGVSFIVGRENHLHISDVCAALKAVGVRHVKLSAAVVDNNVQANNAYHEPLVDPVAEQAQKAQALNDKTFEVVNHFHTLSERFEKPYSTCPSAHVMTVLGADQTVYTCQDKAYTDGGRLGSVADQRFQTFWESAENRDQLHRLNPEHDCRHHCASHAKNMKLWEYLNLNEDHVAFI